AARKHAGPLFEIDDRPSKAIANLAQTRAALERRRMRRLSALPPLQGACSFCSQPHKRSTSFATVASSDAILLKGQTSMSTIQAEPFALEFNPKTTALLIIDMQRDFVLPGGFGEMLGNDTSLLLKAAQPTEQVLAKAREKGMFIVHTREGHRPDLSD